MTRNSKLVTLGLVALAVCMGVSITAGQSQASFQATNHGNVTVALPNDISSFDPQTISSGYDGVLLAYDTLVGFDAHNRVVPQIADSWTVKPQSVSLHIRAGVTCQDGTPMTPSVIKNSFDRLLTLPAAAANERTIFGTGKITITANNSKRLVTFDDSQPFGDMLGGLGYFSAAVICPAGIQNPSALATQPQGSGPYHLSSSVKGSSYVFSRRSHYNWGPAAASTDRSNAPDQVTLQIVSDPTTASNMFLTGQVNIVGVVGQDRTRVLRQKSKGWVLRGTVTQKITAVFNQAPGHVTDDPAVRRAIQQALDRKTYARLATGSSANAGNSYISSVTPCYSDTLNAALPTYSTANATKTLAKDGWKRNASGQWMKDGHALQITLLTTDRVPTSEYVQAQLSQFGVSVKMQNLDLNSYVNEIFGRAGATSSFDIVLLTAGAGNNWSPATATLLLSGPLPPAGNNISGTFNKAAYKLATKAQQNVGAAACGFWAKTQLALTRNVTFVPMTDVVKTWIGNGVTFNLGLQGTISYATIGWSK